MTDVTQILNAIEQGDAKEADKLLPLIYEELRSLAQPSRLSVKNEFFTKSFCGIELLWTILI